MDSVVLDKDVLLDFLSVIRPDHDVVAELVHDLQASGVNVCVASTSLKDIYYDLGRSDGKAVALASVTSLLATTVLLPVNEDCCSRAMTCGEPDFEDGIIRAAAEIAHADYLISGNTHAFIGSLVPRLSPVEALRELNRRP